jgi:diguanylate cyclase (GGDEF)-like protein
MPKPCVRKTAWVIALSLACAAPARADWPSLADTIIRTVAVKRSMPVPVSPFAFAQDRAGFLWAGGQAGLLRWDGYQFRAYTPSSGWDDGLRNHFIQVLHTDRNGRLWAGTEEGGLARYDESTDQFQPVALADQGGEAQRVWCLDDDGQGGLWVGTSRGIAHLDAQGRIVPPRAVPGSPASTVFALPGRNVEALVRSRQGTLWIGGGEGLARIGPDGRALAVKLPAADGATPEVSNLMQDSAGHIWAGTRYSGAFLIDPATLLARAVPAPQQNAGLEIAAMAEVEPGRIWLGTFGHGILDVTAANLSVRAITRDPTVPGTLDSNLVYGLYKDRSGITWIGTSEAIDRFVPPAVGIHTLFAHPDRPGGIPANVSAVLARPDGSVWLGSETDGEGIHVLDDGGATLRTMNLPRVLCLAAEANGPVYIGTRRGLFVASPSGDTVRRLDFATGRSNAGVVSLLLHNGVLWLGGGDGDGLWELHPAANGALAVVRHLSAPPLPTASIESLAPAPGGLLAVGTAHGLALLNPATGAVENITLDAAGPHDMATGQIVSFLTDRHRRLWIGTDDSGIAVMLGRDAADRPLFHRITTADGLPDVDMNRMLADDAGRIWVATDNGLAVIDPETFAVRPLRDADGVAIATYLNLSGDRTPQGDLLFGGHGGLTVVRPQNLNSWTYRPPLAISEIHIGGKPVRTRAPEIVIPPSANSLAVEFAALDFSAPDRNMYRYMLEGFDTGFIATDARHRMATYTNLPPGSYTLRVQGTSRTGVWTEPVRTAIHVLPAWFQTIYVRIAGVAALGLLGLWVVQGRTLWLRRRQVYLEGLVRERTSELVTSQQKLTQLAYFDALTALPNRRCFNEALQEALCDGEDFVLILIDLDGFKRVNDTLGHDAGDELLVIAAARLRAALREGDSVARLGGDEFAILLKRGLDHEVVKTVCDRVVTGMTAPVEIKGQPVKIGASVGVALSPRHGRTAEDLYKHADQALYDAKRAGKGIWRWYQDALLPGA